MSQLALYLFGRPRLEMDGTAVHIPRRKAMAMLVYLAVSGQSHSRDALATLLWPENDQSSARAELRRTLSVLNRTLGDGWFAADRETARLNTENDLSTGKPFWLDVDDFQEKLKVCERHNHPLTVTCPDCLPTLEETVELYQDDFMASFSLKDCREYDEWQFFKREELRTKLTNTLVRLSAYYANALEYETAISYARRWLALDPLQEAAYRQLMSLFSQSGQRTVALRQYETCRQTLDDELGVEPSDETKELYQKIQASTLVTAAALRPKSNLPVQSTPFIGRVNELAEIREKLKQDDCRLLTLLGPGGSGKTRLAIEAAGGLLADYKNGVFFVNLAPLEEPARIPTTIATALSFSFFEEGTPEEQLLDYLRNKELLLILDNFEHLLVGVIFVNQIINAASDVKILATSRTPLMVTGEHIFDVGGMAYPGSPISVGIASHQFSAIKLFESQAGQVQGDFMLSEDNLSDVVRICALVEGMPLGIVLAARWVMMLTPAEIGDEITRDLTFLETELQDLPERQRGIRSVFNHSWRLLSENERKVMEALSVFRGGFTREAAQKIAGASLNDLMRLTYKSMLHRTSAGRYEIHELLRQYAAKKLAMDLEIENATRDKLGNFYCQALANWESALEGPQQGIAMKEMIDEIDNIRTAWEWGIESNKVNITMSALNSLCYFYHQQTLQLEGQKVCHFVVDKLPPRQAFTQLTASSIDKKHQPKIETLKLWLTALIWDGFFNLWLGNVDRVRLLLEKSLTAIENSELPKRDRDMLKAGALHTLSLVVRPESQDESFRLLEESLELFRSLDLTFHVGYVLENMGVYTKTREERIRFFEESLAVRRKQGDLGGIASILISLSGEAAGIGKFRQAEGMANEALNIYKHISIRDGVINSIRYLGFIYLLQGNFELARDVQQECLSLYRDRDSTPSWALAYAVAGYADLFMGNYEAASRQARKSLTQCRGKRHLWFVSSTAHAKSILGNVALVNRFYSEAKQWYQESIPSFQYLNNELAPTEQNNIGQELACLGYASRGLNVTPYAKKYCFEALHAAIEIEGLLALINSLPGVALLFADQGDAERAVEIYALAATQGIVANSKWFDDIAGDEITRAAERLPAEVAEAAKARGQKLDLWGTAEALLAELEKMGWGDCSDADQLPFSTK